MKQNVIADKAFGEFRTKLEEYGTIAEINGDDHVSYHTLIGRMPVEVFDAAFDALEAACEADYN